jgi:hypothetical protein
VQLASKKADFEPSSLNTHAFRSVPKVSLGLAKGAFPGPFAVFLRSVCIFGGVRSAKAEPGSVDRAAD